MVLAMGDKYSKSEGSNFFLTSYMVDYRGVKGQTTGVSREIKWVPLKGRLRSLIIHVNKHDNWHYRQMRSR